MEKRAIYRDPSIPAPHQPFEVPQPGECALEYIPAAVVPKFAIVLQNWLCTIPPMRTNQIDSALSSMFLKRVAVAAFINDHPFHVLARHFHLAQGGFDQLDFHWRGRSKCASQRNTLAVDNHHLSLYPLPFRSSRRRAPFFPLYETAVSESLLLHQILFLVEISQSGLPDVYLLPEFQTSTAGVGVRIPFRQVLPARFGFEDTENTLPNPVIAEASPPVFLDKRHGGKLWLKPRQVVIL